MLVVLKLVAAVSCHSISRHWSRYGLECDILAFALGGGENLERN